VPRDHGERSGGRQSRGVVCVVGGKGGGVNAEERKGDAERYD